jgi:hypothetical protein
MSAKTKVTKTKTALTGQQAGNVNLSDLRLKHDLHCGFVELPRRLGLGLILLTNTIGSNNSKFATIALERSSSLLMSLGAFVQVLF